MRLFEIQYIYIYVYVQNICFISYMCLVHVICV